MNKICYYLISLCFCVPVFAQKHHEWCAHDQKRDALAIENPQIAKLYQETDRILAAKVAELQASKSKSQGLVYTIPVVFHIIYNDYTDNITRAQIEDGLRILNEDFRRLNPDTVNTRSQFVGVAADIEVEFKLAKKDPNGNCTEGITRTQSSESVGARDNVKDLINWDNDEYLNIWVVNSIQASSGSTGTVLGYAYRPFPGQGYKQDGIVIRHDALGSIGSSDRLGRTLTHEAGHYLGLLHPFDSGCNGDDGISDTPPVASASFGCNTNQNSCTNDFPDLPDMIENYMDYADDVCTNLFTNGQKTVMRASLTSSSLRQYLRSSTNLFNTGVTNPPACTPVALLLADKRSVCFGDTVKFTDISEDGDPTTWSWSFPGGTPSTSSAQHPEIVYNAPGVHNVTLTVSNSAGTDTKTYTDEIFVKSDNPGHATNWVEGFEAAQLPLHQISILDAGDGIAFELTNQAASLGSQSLKLDNFQATIEGEIDNMISPALDLWTGANVSLEFDYAFAAKDNTNDDELKVFVSRDCGATWIMRRFYNGNVLRTAPNTTQAFVPSSSEWTTQTIGLDAYIGTNPLLVRFEFTAGGGNNFYLDNIRITGTIGIDENGLNSRVNIFPNPTQGDFTIEVEKEGLQELDLDIRDITGKMVFSNSYRNIDGYLSVNPTQGLNLREGVYLVRLSTADGVETHRIVVQ